jgi:hypothetical protein
MGASHSGAGRRRLWVAMAISVAVGPLLAGEARHFARYGHLGAGLHADAVYDPAMNFGIPGVGGAYSVQLVNLTPIPIPARTCRPPSDTSFRPLLYRYRIERKELRTAEWVNVLELPAGDCAPFPTAWKLLWPGLPVTAVQWEATAARKGLRKGDVVRFTVYRDFRAPDTSLLQIGATSQEVQMIEESTDPGTTYRVAH